MFFFLFFWGGGGGRFIHRKRLNLSALEEISIPEKRLKSSEVGLGVVGLRRGVWELVVEDNS